MKKVGILNFHYSNSNYGAVLQASALEHYIHLHFKHDTEHINFVPPPMKKNLKHKIGNLLRAFGIKKKISSITINDSNVFEDFRNKWITRGPLINDHKQINSNDYWIVIVGSDQVWRPIMTKPYELIYFLSFCSKDCIRASYAASFGINDWPYNIKTTNKISNELDDFSAISCREIGGKEICKNIFSKESTLVLDPTLLIGSDFFDRIIEDNKEVIPLASNDIVYYKLDIDEKFNSQIDKLSKKLNTKSCNIYYTTNNDENNFLSVPIWLEKIKNSKIIITDSFHCVCFSILYNKPFLFYPNEGRGLSRLESLLSILGLEHLICYDGNIINNESAYSIEYTTINSKLHQLRKESHNFLWKILNNHD